MEPPDAGGAAPDEEALPRLEAEGGRRSCVMGGRPVRSISVHADAVVLEAHAPEGAMSLRIAGGFLLDEGSGEVALSPRRPRELGPLAARVGAALASADVDASGVLALRFEDGARLRVPPGGPRPAWSVQGSGDLEAVAVFLEG